MIETSSVTNVIVRDYAAHMQSPCALECSEHVLDKLPNSALKNTLIIVRL